MSAALETGLNRDALRSVIRGRAPSIDRADEICRALGIELLLGKQPASDRRDPDKEPGAWTPSPQAHQRLRIRALVVKSRRGCWTRETRPAPAGFDDPAGFYARAADDGLAPAGIRKNGLALVAPGSEPRAGDLAWLVDGTNGEEVLGLVVRTSRDGYDVVRWLGDHKNEEFIPTASSHARADRGRIVGMEPPVDGRKRLEPDTSR